MAVGRHSGDLVCRDQHRRSALGQGCKDPLKSGKTLEGFSRLERIFAALAERGATVLISTHQIARVAPHCHRAVVLREGKAAWLGAARDVPHEGELWSRAS